MCDRAVQAKEGKGGNAKFFDSDCRWLAAIQTPVELLPLMTRFRMVCYRFEDGEGGGVWCGGRAH